MSKNSEYKVAAYTMIAKQFVNLAHIFQSDSQPSESHFMKGLIITCLLSAILMPFAFGQYSYITDRRFDQVDDLLGYTFKPNKLLNHKRGTDKNLGPKDIAFTVSQNYLYITSENETATDAGAYSVVSINPDKYGYKLQLMNARNPTQQGHLKVILNDLDQVDALIFKKASKSEEIIYYQAAISDRINAREEDHFSDLGEHYINDTELMWDGMEVKPFMVTGEKQDRVSMRDSLSFTFTVDTVYSGRKKKMSLKRAVNLRFFQYDKENPDDEPKEIKQRYVVSKIKEKTAAASTNPEPTRVELSTNKGSIYLFLAPDRTISSLETGDGRFLLRGH